MENYNSSKKVLLTAIGVAILVISVVGVAFAFFNYIRTGSSNTIKTGRIAFNTNQTSTLTLTNIFPVASNSVGNDYTQDTLKVTITGDTMYDDGVEYLITAEEVNVVTNTGKRVPLSFNIGVTGNLGTEDEENDQIDYFTDRLDKDTSYYKLLDDTVKYDGQYLLVGYIAKGATGINGTLNIKAYLDKDKILISDTYDGTESDNMGTSNSMAEGKTVITTTEWNGLAESGHELSFKVKIEANEGIWVDEIDSVNASIRIPAQIQQNVTEVYFVRLTESKMQQEYDAATVKADLTDTTLNEGKVLAWQDNGKLYIASTGKTYLPANCLGYFGSGAMGNITTIEFYNVDTSRVTNMSGMFASCHSLTSIDISSFDTSNVTSMNSMFYGCSSLKEIDLSNKGSTTLSNVYTMFSSCGSLTKVNMHGFNFGDTANLEALFSSLSSLKSVDLSDANTSKVTSMQMLFGYSEALTDVNLSGIDTSKVTNMNSMFWNCTSLKMVDLSSFNTSSVTSTNSMFTMATWASGTGYTPISNSLTTIYVGNNWNLSSVTNSNYMFYNCEHLVGGSGTTFDSSYIDKTRGIVDGGTSNPGYLTLKTN